METYLLNVVNFETLIATKAARMVEAAAGRPVVDFGFRRAHGPDAGLLAARAAYIGGCVATATVAAGILWDIPTTGTMAHSYVMGFRSEVDAFAEFLREHGDTAALLIDTYNPVRGARRAAEAARATGVAHDSCGWTRATSQRSPPRCGRYSMRRGWGTPRSSRPATSTST